MSEGLPVGLRAGSDELLELVSEGGGRGEADLDGDAFDGVAGDFQQVLSPEAAAVEPAQRGGAGLFPEAAVEAGYCAI